MSIDTITDSLSNHLNQISAKHDQIKKANQNLLNWLVEDKYQKILKDFVELQTLIATWAKKRDLDLSGISGPSNQSQLRQQFKTDHERVTKSIIELGRAISRNLNRYVSSGDVHYKIRVDLGENGQCVII